ncbi:unnamed protein product [Blepharisma stoltei]|uniref:Uncharacterized protein n=1 Tax=Blepharisma stoltei TaxID=1481888 RepID=A0AAU9IT59_9CILI|nr:unnamed protein product [Blepharisma stoltei]
MNELLEFSHLPINLSEETLHTLNGLVSHQSTKDKMINSRIMESCGNLLNSENWTVRMEAAYLIGGLIFMMQGRNIMILNDVFPPLQRHLTDENTNVREAVAWTLCRLSNSRDGVAKLAESCTIITMVSAFINFSKAPKTKNKMCLLYLLEAFINISEYDIGIEPMLGTGLMKSLINFLKLAKKYKEQEIVMIERTLHVISHITIHPIGKIEGTDENAISAASKYINSNRSYEQKRLGTAVIMTVTIELEGKNQAVGLKKNDKFKVLERLFELLKGEHEDIRINAKQCFHNIADLPEGFDKSVTLLSSNLPILDEVFGIRAIKPLIRLLPKLNTYENPPHISPQKLPFYQQYVKAINFLIEKYEDAESEAIDTPNISQKLGPFLSEESGVSKETSQILRKICIKDAHNKEVLKKFINDYGDEGIKRNMVKYPNLMNIIS